MMNKTCGCFADLIMHTSTFLCVCFCSCFICWDGSGSGAPQQVQIKDHHSSSGFGSDLGERWRLVLMIWCGTPLLTGSECAAHSGPSFGAPYAPSCLLSCFHGSDCCCHVVSVLEPHISQHSRSPELILHEIKNVFLFGPHAEAHIQLHQFCLSSCQHVTEV